MKPKKFVIQAFRKAYDRNIFDCGSQPLNEYLRHHISQDLRRNLTTCFLALDQANNIAGYYTLASASIDLSTLPAHLAKKLPRYPTVPAVLMGRMAIDKNYQGQGLGGVLLADALHRIIRSGIGAYALVVDAKDEQAAEFYRHFGFLPLTASPLKLFLPVATARAAVSLDR